MKIRNWSKSNWKSNFLKNKNKMVAIRIINICRTPCLVCNLQGSINCATIKLK